jgi:hypothetical protein
LANQTGPGPRQITLTRLRKVVKDKGSHRCTKDGIAQKFKPLVVCLSRRTMG